MSFHLCSLRNQVIEHLIVTDPINWEEDEDSTSDQRTTNLINEQIIPVCFEFPATRCFLIRWLSCVDVPFISETDPEDFKGVKDNRSPRRTSNVTFPPEYENSNSEEEDREWKEVSSPEVNTCFKLSGCQTGKTADIDCPVKPGIHSLNCDCWIDYDAFAVLLDLDETFGIGVLFYDQSRDICFDSSSADPDNYHGDNETCGVGCLASRGNGSTHENELTNGINTSEYHDGFIAAEVLIRDNRAKYWCNITPCMSIQMKKGRYRIERSFPDQWRPVGQDQDILWGHHWDLVKYSFETEATVRNR